MQLSDLFRRQRALTVASVCSLAFLAAGVSSAAADSLTRSVEVNGTPAEVWSLIGPFCAIKDWLPPVGSCTEDGKTPPTRTLVTKDGSATFVETQTGRSSEKRSYSYTFKSSPLPVTHYVSTIEVTARGPGQSTVTWSSTYTANEGKEKEAKEALNGVYTAGLDFIKSRFAK
ncbi:MAG: SRPBCC family protein [Reyranella sp.]|nr:SRPBCC family protein [Reyranella sp.]MDP3160047.1 SRPBCC family protein [Reyranella sp.]